ncbi:MAG: protein kinase domain-containing protein [Kofleriaceae bacterium]
MHCPHCHAPNADDARFCGACGGAMSSTAPASNPALGELPGAAMIGREIAGRFRIQSKLGEGGMGAVFRAEQMSLKRVVALKLLRPDVAASPVLLRRFNAEAEAVAKLKHPNTVQIYDFGQDADGTLFISMELVEGRSLRQVLRDEAPLSPRRALAIAAQVAASLADAHARTVIHRDLKPDNVMLTDRGRARDHVTVLDFGIAKLHERGTQGAMTQAGDMLGTPQYMAPEQIRAEAIDGRTDVYALGCMLYEMVTARLPFEATTVMALLSKHLLEHAPPPSHRRPELALPPVIDELILAAMAKDPAHRPPAMEAYGEPLPAVLATLPPEPTGQISAVHGAPPAPPPAGYVETPVAPSAAFQPHTPPPFHPPTQPPPGSAFAHPLPTPAPASALVSAPAPVQAPGPAPRPARRGGRTLAIALGVLALAGAGVGIYVATRPSGPAPVAPVADDPWGGSAGPSTTLILPSSARLIPPPGYALSETATRKRLVDHAAGVTITMVGVPPGTDDPDELGGRVAAESGMVFEGSDSIHSHGEPRFTIELSGVVNGVAVKQLGIAYLSARYRIGVLISAPVALAADDQFVAWVARFLESNVVLPPT